MAGRDPAVCAPTVVPLWPLGARSRVGGRVEPGLPHIKRSQIDDQLGVRASKRSSLIVGPLGSTRLRSYLSKARAATRNNAPAARCCDTILVACKALQDPRNRIRPRRPGKFRPRDLHDAILCPIVTCITQSTAGRPHPCNARASAHMSCPIARSLERVGEWWSILILRDAFLGLTRFDQFQKSLGIAPNMLTRRLNALVETGLLERRLLQRAPAARRIRADRARPRFPPGAVGACSPGATAFRARRAERRGGRRRDRPARRSGAGRPRQRQGDDARTRSAALPAPPPTIASASATAPVPATTPAHQGGRGHERPGHRPRHRGPCRAIRRKPDRPRNRAALAAAGLAVRCSAAPPTRSIGGPWAASSRPPTTPMSAATSRPIAPHVAGFVAQVLVPTTSASRPGQTLVRLDADDYQAALRHAEAVLQARAGGAGEPAAPGACCSKR